MFLQEYNNVFLEKGAKRQLFPRDIEYKIKLLPGIKLPHGLIYPLSAERLETFKNTLLKILGMTVLYYLLTPQGPPYYLYQRTTGLHDYM